MVDVEFLNAKFLQAMNDIGRYGNDKYGKESFHYRQKTGDRSRGVLARAKPDAIAAHAREHFEMYIAANFMTTSTLASISLHLSRLTQ
jgi:hypothetical protein